MSTTPPPPDDYPPPSPGSPGDYPPPAGGQPPPHQPGQQQWSGHGGGPTPTNALAIAALVIGILSLPAAFTVIFGIILGIAAIVLGVMGLNKAKTMQDAGRGLAIGGIVTGVIGLVLSLLIVLAGAALIGAVGGAIDDGGINIDGTEFEFPTE